MNSKNDITTMKENEMETTMKMNVGREGWQKENVKRFFKDMRRHTKRERERERKKKEKKRNREENRNIIRDILEKQNGFFFLLWLKERKKNANTHTERERERAE